MISVILPTFNEIDSGYLGPIMSRLPRLGKAEILAVDGGSTDGTVEFIAGHGVEVLSLPGSSRAARMNLGIEQSQGEMLLLHHQDVEDVGPRPNWSHVNLSLAHRELHGELLKLPELLCDDI